MKKRETKRNPLLGGAVGVGGGDLGAELGLVRRAAAASDGSVGGENLRLFPPRRRRRLRR